MASGVYYKHPHLCKGNEGEDIFQDYSTEVLAHGIDRLIMLPSKEEGMRPFKYLTAFMGEL